MENNPTISHLVLLEMNRRKLSSSIARLQYN